jgi:hypothetical protein
MVTPCQPKAPGLSSSTSCTSGRVRRRRGFRINDSDICRLILIDVVAVAEMFAVACHKCCVKTVFTFYIFCRYVAYFDELRITNELCSKLQTGLIQPVFLCIFSGILPDFSCPSLNINRIVVNFLYIT